MAKRGEVTADEGTKLERADRARPQGEAARKRAAVELVARHEGTLKRTARRYSLDDEDAADAYQRALEIVLTKAPTTDPRELIRWTQTVTKHEALAVRESRERLLGRGGAGASAAVDPVTLIPAASDGPDEQVERRESIARSREALRALKPAELRALTLLAQGYSYAEIGELTGFSRTKTNRLLAEGRERFRRLLSNSEDGTRCRELRPLLSAFCDGEANAIEEQAVREHLRACAGCRATMKAYRAAPRIAAGLVPALPQSRSLLERFSDFLGLSARLPGLGGGGDSVAQVAAAGGSRGLGVAAMAKLLALCAGAAGGAACVATGALPTPLDLPAPDRVKPTIERSSAALLEAGSDSETDRGVAEATAPDPTPDPPAKTEQEPQSPAETTSSESTSAGATEYVPPPEPSPAPAVAPAPEPATSEPASSSSGSAAGEFGP